MRKLLAGLLILACTLLPAQARNGNHPLWSGSRGFNLIALGFLNPLNGTACPNAYSGTDLDYLKARNVDWVRIPFDPTSILAETSGSAAESTLIGYVTACVDLMIAHGFKVLLDSHVSLTDSGWTAAQILADYPNGTKFTRYTAFLGTMGTKLIPYAPATVSFQQFNEWAGDYAPNVNAINLALYSAFRTTNTITTVVIGGNQYSAIDGLAGWTLSGFTGNFIVGVTPYVPQQFTHQGINDGSYYAAYNRLTFPATGSEGATVGAQIAAYPICPTSAPNCYNSAADKTNAQTYVYNSTGPVPGYYFSTPDDDAWLTQQINLITAFAVANNLPANRILVTEFGSHGDAITTGATTAQRATWMSSIRGKFEARGFGWNLWHWDDSYFTIGFPTLNTTLCNSLGLSSC